MNKDERQQLTKRVIDECIIYPKAHPSEIEEEIEKINKLIKQSETSTPSHDKLVSRLSKSFDIKQRIKNEKEWIKYVEN